MCPYLYFGLLLAAARSACRQEYSKKSKLTNEILELNRFSFSVRIYNFVVRLFVYFYSIKFLVEVNYNN